MRNMKLSCLLGILYLVVIGFIHAQPEGLQAIIPSDISFTGQATLSRSSGVAPLSIHFVVDVPRSSTTERQFHDFEYVWDFDDIGSVNWTTSGKSKNIAKGPIAAHVYEEPGSYTAVLEVKYRNNIVHQDTFTIMVSNPDTIYSGTNTTCVCNVGTNDFTGCPPNSRRIETDDLTTITQYATAGSRILLHRGSSWTVSSVLNWPNNGGPVTIGAYGSGEKPLITGAGGNIFTMDRKQDWRIMDLNLVDTTGTNGSFVSGIDVQRQLYLRLDIQGFSTGLQLGHWNDNSPMVNELNAVVDCKIWDSDYHAMYIGSERLALLGNTFTDAHQSHTVRVWQAYRSVISHNRFSGSSIDSQTGRHALKLHGPDPGRGELCAELTPQTHCLVNRTEFLVVSDNVFGAAGPWPVAIGPQDQFKEENLSDIIFERNRVVADYGTQSSPVNTALHAWGRYFTIRNNVFDGTGGAGTWRAIIVERRGIEWYPLGIAIYNNTIYRGDSGQWENIGVMVSSEAVDTLIINNLISFPNDFSGSDILLDDQSGASITSSNLMTDNPSFSNPDSNNPITRDFNLLSESPAIDQGTTIAVFDDFEGSNRPLGNYDIGALESH